MAAKATAARVVAEERGAQLAEELAKRKVNLTKSQKQNEFWHTQIRI